MGHSREGGINLAEALHHLAGQPMPWLGSKAASDGEACRHEYAALLAGRTVRACTHTVSTHVYRNAPVRSCA